MFMRKITRGLPLLAALSLAACIQDEAQNAECDIEMAQVVVPDGADVEALFFKESDAVKEVPSSVTTIVFTLREGFSDSTLLEALRLNFRLTPGATITPENGSEHDFTDGGVSYRVTSEDGQWHRDYLVKFSIIQPVGLVFSFEHFRPEPNGRYSEWYELPHGGMLNQWATGNPGFAISRSSATPEEFPTIPWTENTVSGKAVKLETCDTGPFGAMVDMRIAPGNLFVGTFDVTYALKDAMVATHFGLPFNRKPVSFEGYYKFTPGAKFQDEEGRVIEGRVDDPDLYAILYRNTDENGQPFSLLGDNVLYHYPTDAQKPTLSSFVLGGDTVWSHRNSVGMARVMHPKHDFNEWTYFNIDFVYNAEVDENLLQDYGYNLAVVFTSSVEGASFRGAIGSTLLIDEVKVNCE